MPSMLTKQNFSIIPSRVVFATRDSKFNMVRYFHGFHRRFTRIDWMESDLCADMHFL